MLTRGEFVFSLALVRPVRRKKTILLRFHIRLSRFKDPTFLSDEGVSRCQLRYTQHRLLFTEQNVQPIQQTCFLIFFLL